MTNIQPTMENFNKNSTKETLDLRPEGHEAVAEAAQAKKQALLDQQAAASNSQPNRMDITPSGPSQQKGFNQVPGINSQATGESNVFKLNPNELENPPTQIPQTNDNPQSSQAENDNPAASTDNMENSDQNIAPEPQKKPGLFGRLFGKK